MHRAKFSTLYTLTYFLVCMKCWKRQHRLAFPSSDREYLQADNDAWKYFDAIYEHPYSYGEYLQADNILRADISVPYTIISIIESF